MKAHKLIEIRQRLKEAEEMKEKVEKELATPIESTVRQSRQPIDNKGKADLEGAVKKVNSMLRMKGLVENKTAWTVTASVGKRKFNDKLTWEVKKVKEEVDPVVVSEKVGKALVAVFGRTGDILNIWVENKKSVKLMVLSAPLRTERGQEGLAKAIQEENKKIKLVKRFPKLWEMARIIGFTIDMKDNDKAKRVIRNGIIWDGHRRKVSYFEQATLQKEG
ncbi:hypothetical protein L211DRAFT_854337 [Terfezia boudieri ATCC MYA-4762]|uniref:Uncharacterized protein n=1 Tax=Terfezia boudieri ATCC MYA-4762 TaxID=1051890 RepID=A0A3N4L5Q0_9PEZI|nr:hypothetical protein L211DRAFT_854337 [Terfezia boudieri ATCC MYA-4762]